MTPGPRHPANGRSHTLRRQAGSYKATLRAKRA
jgi:hypothetical protein